MCNRIKFLLIECCAWLGISSIHADVLIETRWDQGFPYNIECPQINETTSKTGCGATAIAQILYYYQRPIHGYGNVCYKSSNITDSIRADMTSFIFDWSNMLTRYPSDRSYSEVEANAVSSLMYACGLAMYMDYSTSASSVRNYATMIYGLQKHLHFSASCRYLHRKYYSTEEWEQIINNQIKEGYPILYRGDWRFNNMWNGHMFLLDSIVNGQYHMNYGHNGMKDQYGIYDKYVDLCAIGYSGTYPGNRGVCYSSRQAMVIDAYPTPDEIDFPEQRCVSDAAIILNKDKYMQTATFSIGETFTLSCRLRNVCDRKAIIHFGWALVQHNEWQRQLTDYKYTLGAGNTFSESHHQSLSIPEDIEDGVYQLTLYSKSDIDPDWHMVWEDAPNTVDMVKRNGKITIIVPDNHMLDPQLSITDEIQEIDTWRSDLVAGRTFRMTFSNTTTNNFEDTVKIVFQVNGQLLEYKEILTIYSQTNTTYEWLVPQAQLNLNVQDISSISLYYLYDGEYKEISVLSPLVTACEHISSDLNKEQLYDILGRPIRMLKKSKRLNNNIVITTLQQ